MASSSLDISIMEEFWLQIFKISLIEGVYVKSRMSQSQGRKPNPHRLLSWDLQIASISLDSVGLCSPIICLDVWEPPGRQEVAPLGHIKWALGCIKWKLVLFLREFPSLTILLQENSLVIYVDKCFIFTFGLVND